MKTAKLSLLFKINLVNFIFLIFTFFSLLNAQNFDNDKAGFLKNNKSHTIKFQYSKELQNHINFIKKQNFKNAFQLNSFYSPLFEQKLYNQGLPYEFKYLAILESRMDYRAVSKANAKGLWQIIPNTGFELGLLENKCISNYFDPLASTHYATSYLRWLYDYIKDYNLTLAAYNWGIGNVLNLVKKHKTKDFYLLKNYMPEETRNYVFRFHALVYLSKTKYKNIKPIKNYLYNEIVTVKLEKTISKNRLKKMFYDFEFLNPQFLCENIPKGAYIYILNEDL